MDCFMEKRIIFLFCFIVVFVCLFAVLFWFDFFFNFSFRATEGVRGGFRLTGKKLELG